MENETRPKWFLVKDNYGTGYANTEEGKEKLRKDIQQAELYLAYLKDLQANQT